MKNQKSQNQRPLLFFLLALCLTLWSGAVSGQQRPPTPLPPPLPNAPLSPVKAPTNPLLAPPTAPKPVQPKVFAYVLIPFETLEPTAKMTPDQSVKIKPIYDKLEVGIATLRASAKTPEEKNALNDKIRAMQAESNKQIDAVLDPAQRKKVDGLMFEMMEMISVGVSPQMLHDMRLTPEQRTAILKIVSDVQAKINAVMKDVPAKDRQAEYKAKYPAIMEAERLRIAPLLTPAQKAIYDRYDTGGRIIGSPRPFTPRTPAPIAPLPAPPKTAPAPTSPPPIEPSAPAPEKKP